MFVGVLSFASKTIILPDVKRFGEKPKIITELIDRIDQFREDLFTIQRKLEKLEDRDSADGVGRKRSKVKAPAN